MLLWYNDYRGYSSITLLFQVLFLHNVKHNLLIYKGEIT